MIDASTRDAVTWTLGTIVTVFAIIGIAVRFVLMPYLREHLIAPVKQVEKQVTENSHANAQPTVLDRIDDVSQDVRVLTRALEGHMEWSERWVGVVEREIDQLRREQGHPARPTPRTDDRPEED